MSVVVHSDYNTTNVSAGKIAGSDPWSVVNAGRGGWGKLAAFLQTIHIKIEDIFLHPLNAGRSGIHFTLLGCKLKMMGSMLTFKFWHTKKVCRAVK